MSDSGRRVSRRWLVPFAFVLALTIASASIVYAATVASGGAVTAVRMASDGNSVSTQSTTSTAVPGMSVTLKVPSGDHALLLVTFSAESKCSASVNAVAGCWVEVAMDDGPFGGLLATPPQVMFASDNYNDGDDEISSRGILKRF